MDPEKKEAALSALTILIATLVALYLVHLLATLPGIP